MLTMCQALQLSQFILTTTLEDRYYSYAHSMEKETEAEESDLLRVTQMNSKFNILPFLPR